MLEKEYTDQVFFKENFSLVDGSHVSFLRCTFDGCNCTETNFSHARFMDSKFKGCNVSLVKLHRCRLQGVEFENSKLVGVNFYECDKTFLRLKFIKCLVDTSNFSDLDLKEVSFRESIVRNTHFKGANLSGSDFRSTNLSGTLFHHTKLEGANFVDAKNYAINPTTNVLLHAKFSLPEAYHLLDYLGIEIES